MANEGQIQTAQQAGRRHGRLLRRLWDGPQAQFAAAAVGLIGISASWRSLQPLSITIQDIHMPIREILATLFALVVTLAVRAWRRQTLAAQRMLQVASLIVGILGSLIALPLAFYGFAQAPGAVIVALAFLSLIVTWYR